LNDGVTTRGRHGVVTTTSSCRDHDDVTAPTTTTTTSPHRGTRGRRRRRPRRHGAATSSARCVEVVVGQNPPTMMRWAKVKFPLGRELSSLFVLNVADGVTSLR